MAVEVESAAEAAERRFRQTAAEAADRSAREVEGKKGEAEEKGGRKHCGSNGKDCSTAPCAATKEDGRMGAEE